MKMRSPDVELFEQFRICFGNVEKLIHRFKK